MTRMEDEIAADQAFLRLMQERRARTPLSDVMAERLRHALEDATGAYDPPPSGGRAMRFYRDRNDWWVGYYRGDQHHYVCLLPTLVIRWPRFVPYVKHPLSGRAHG